MTLVRGGLAAVVLLSLAATQAFAQQLPPAELSQLPAAPEVASEAGVVAADEAAQDNAEPQLIEIYSRGYSRFEISDVGHILVVYSGGVEFSYLGFALRADELRFDQATRSALVSGDVRLSSEQLILTSQTIELDGVTGHGAINGHLVGTLVESGVRFEAARADLVFPAGATDFQAELTQLTLSGAVAVFGPNGIELRSEQIAFDGSARRFSTAPFSLRASLAGSGGKPPSVLQIDGTAASGLLSESGEIAEITVLGIRAVTQQARLTAAQAVARPNASGELWRIDLTGDPVRLEMEAADLPALNAKPEAAPVSSGPILLQSANASVEVDGAGLLSAGLGGGAVIAALGNRLEAASVSIDRRATGYALSLGGLKLGLDLARLTGIQPVDLSQLID